MSKNSDTSETFNLSDLATLKLLVTLEQGDAMSQRSLASRIGVALGMTNSLLKRAVRKGLVKVMEAPAKRYAYYVTPKGFGEKSRLTAQYLSSSLHLFRRAREEYFSVFSAIQKEDRQSVVLYGASDLAEIAVLAAQMAGVDPKFIVDPQAEDSTTSCRPIVSDIDSNQLDDIDAIVLTHMEEPQKAYEQMVERFGREKVFVVPLMHVNPLIASVEEDAQ